MRKSMFAAVAAGAALLIGCSADEADYSKEAADFIETDTVESAAGTTFEDATCEKPASTSVGSTFNCTATAADGAEWTFGVEITAENEFTVQSAAPSGG